MVAHFSPLISGRGDHTYFLDKAPVMQVPWREIAIHVLHKQVDNTHTHTHSYPPPPLTHTGTTQ